DRLGRQCVSELVWVDVSDTCALGDGGDVAVDRAPVEGLAVVALNEQPAGGWSALGAVVRDQLDQHREERDVAVVVKFADRYAQPERVAEADHGVGWKRGG